MSNVANINAISQIIASSNSVMNPFIYCKFGYFIKKSSKTHLLRSIDISAFSRSDVRHSLLKMRSLDSYMSGKRDRRPTKASITTSPPLICANRAHVPDLIPIADSTCR